MQNQLNKTDSNQEGEGFTSRLQVAVDKLDEGIKAGKDKLAAAMDSGSEQLLSGVEAVEDKALASAVQLSDGAKYLRDTSARAMFSDCCSLAEKYPFHAMAVAGIAGLLVGKSIYSNSTQRS